MEASLAQYFFCFIIINIVFLLSYFDLWTKKYYRLTWTIILFFCVFAFWNSDYYHFQAIFGKGFTEFRDIIYYYLYKISLNSYSLFRLFIWGLAIICLRFACLRFNLSLNNVTYIFSVFFLLTFSYARASLSMSLYFLGLSFLINPIDRNNSKIYNYLGAFLFFAIAFTSHRSILVPILLTPLAFIEITKKRFTIALLFFPILLFIISLLLQRFSQGQLLTSGIFQDFSESAMQYINLKNDVYYNWKFTLINYLRNSSFYIVCVYLVAKIVYSNNHYDDYVYKLLTLTLLIMMIASSFFISSGQSGLGLSIIGYRYLYMTGIPIVIILSYLMEREYVKSFTLHFLLSPSFIYSEAFLLGKIISLL